MYANHVAPLKEQLQISLRPFPVSGFAVISNLLEHSAFVSAACLYAGFMMHSCAGASHPNREDRYRCVHNGRSRDI